MISSISIVIPVYNSYASIQELTVRLIKVLSLTASEYEIIMVDDGSKDKSIEKIKEVLAKNHAIKLISLTGNFGQQNAIMCGLRYAKGDYVITMDDDLQNPPEEIAALMQEVEKGYDVVYGIPKVKQHSRTRNFGSLMADFLFDAVCGKPRSIRVSSFRVLKKEIVQSVIEEKSSFVYISAATLKYTKNIGNVQVQHEVRRHGTSNYNLWKLLKLFYNIYFNYGRPSKLLVQNRRPQYVIKEMIL
ncbi:MAG: glycosyltransferase [Clostridia bacterium]|jgi:undecaprenyl-phosphate 4-deoxy-4-formamido-L-arabinose transferase|nr:glycosyltransferase [Clostridia bacterium]